MGSQNKSIKLSADLFEVIRLRSAQLGYASDNAFMKGLIRYDAMVQGSHMVTLPISQMRPEEQDQTDAQLLDLVKRGVSVRGAFLTNLLKDIAKGKFSSPEEVGVAVAKMIAKSERGESNHKMPGEA